MADEFVTKSDCADHRQQINAEIARAEAQSIERWKKSSGDLAEREKGLKEWIVRVEGKIDRLILWVMVTEASLLITLGLVLIGRLFDLRVI